MEPEKPLSSQTRNSLSPLALVGILVSFLWVFSKSKAPDNKSGESIRPQNAPTPKTSSGQTRPLPLIINSPANANQSKEGEQRKTPFWEKAAVAVAFGIMVINYFQMRSTQDSADAAKRSADSAEQSAKAAIAAQRPWLKLELRLAIPLTRIPDGYDFAVVPSISNIGNSVATDASLRIEHRIPPMSPNQPASTENMFTVASRVKDWCESTKPNIAGLETFFPRENAEDAPSHMNVLASDMQKGGFTFKGESRFTILVYGCLIYKFEGSPILHRTGVVYQLTAKQNNLPYMLAPNRTYTVDDLMFNPFPFAWEYAN